MPTESLPPAPVATEATTSTSILPNEPRLVTKEEVMGFLKKDSPPEPVLKLPDANDAVLIGLVLDYDKSKWVLEELTPEHFHPLSHFRKPFEIILAIEQAGQKVGFATFVDRLPVEGLFNQQKAKELFDDWRAYWEKGVDLHSAVDSIKYHYKKDQVSALFRKGSNDLDSHRREPNVVALEIADALDGLTASTHIPTVTQQELNEATILSLTSTPAPVYSTGFKPLDQRIGGLSPSRMYIVASRTGVGKSALLLNLLCSLGRQNVQTGFISLEMDRVAMNKRLMGIVGHIQASDLKWPVSEETTNKLNEYQEETGAWRVLWSDRRSMNLGDLKSKLSQFARQGCKVVFVDYLQRVVVESKESRNLQVAQVAKTLADLAERLDMAIVAASQINREGAKADNAPQLHHISESTVIEESADVIILLHNKTKEDDTLGLNRPIGLNVAKNRHGFGGRFDMYYRGRQFRFSDTPFELPTVLPTITSPAPLCPSPTVLPPVPDMKSVVEGTFLTGIRH